MSATTIRVSADVPAPAERVFRRLSDLDAHRDLASPGIEVLSLHGRRGARTGGLVRLNGPLGVRVMARTRVCDAQFPRLLSGEAATPDGTTASLAWHLEPRGRATTVAVVLTARPRSARHRALLALGGRVWLRRHLATAIRRLGRDTQA
ncbi:MAG TPA: SRPBCC family protein [Solirubrobacteraceae bacterium]|nr:SRPBCC family protein [Solirubrobacteraceae bacterium]